MTYLERVAVLERIAKYAREDRAVTSGCTRLARALEELAADPDAASAPLVVWVVRSETRDGDFVETCGAYDSREAAVELVGGFGADTSKDPGDDANGEVSFRDHRSHCAYTISRREVLS